MQFTLSKQYSPARQNITKNYRLDEKTAVDQLVATFDFTPLEDERITYNSIKLINKFRKYKENQNGSDDLM